MSTINALPAEKLYHACDSSLLTFQTTAELEATTEIIGQERAVDAIGFAIDIQRPGFNLFVLGESGSGRHSAVRRLLEAKALEEAVRIEPRSFDYLTALALLYEQEGQKIKAAQTLRKMNELRPNDPVVRDLLRRVQAMRDAE